MAARWRKASSLVYLVGSSFGAASQRFTSVASRTSVRMRFFSAKPDLCDQYISFSHKIQEIQLKVNESDNKNAEQPTKVRQASEDPIGYTNLIKLFKERKELCFHNFLEPPQLHYFSEFSQDIFSKIVTISFSKAKQGFYFKFDPSMILVKHKNGDVLDVAVPISQLRKGRCLFLDKVIGPFAAMLTDMFSTDFKEIPDLLYLANTDATWWSNLKDIHEHPLFWTAEMKITALIVAQIYLSPCSTVIKHDLPNVPLKWRLERIRKFDFDKFRRALGTTDFYERVYSVHQDYSVTFVVTKKDWSQFFTTQHACFHVDYRNKKGFGLGGTERHRGMVTFNRNNVAHYGDENMDGIVHQLKLKSVKALVIGLDRTFNLSLMIYHSLRKLGHHPVPACTEFTN